MGSIAVEELKKLIPNAVIVRRTVPGLKDIPVEMKILMKNEGCDAGIALGWVGPTLTDKITYAVYSLALQLVQLEFEKHIIDVTVHEDEAECEEDLYRIAMDRVRKHVRNLVALLLEREKLSMFAGAGLRQGRPDVGPIVVKKDG